MAGPLLVTLPAKLSKLERRERLTNTTLEGCRSFTDTTLKPLGKTCAAGVGGAHGASTSFRPIADPSAMEHAMRWGHTAARGL
jgi:hypothetical protein